MSVNFNNANRLHDLAKNFLIFGWLSVPLYLIGVLSFGCNGSVSQKTKLNVYELLGETRETLEKRLGESDIFIHKHNNVDTIQWKDVKGVWVFVVLKDGRSNYITFTFKDMEIFDEEEAFRLIGITNPKEKPEYVWENKARRWKPFGVYQKMVVNPETKAITVGDSQPYIGADA